MDTIGIFSTPIGKIGSFLTEDECLFMKRYSEETEYHSYERTSKMSLETNVLGKNFVDIKTRIEETFTKFAYNTLGVKQTCDFKITNSWATSTLPNGYSDKHSHSNSYWSGVLYFDDDTSPLMLYKKPEPSVFLLEVETINNYSTTKISVKPDKGDVVFFPSHVEHQISPNTSSSVRHSIAFNIIPNGIFGYHDSLCNIQVFELKI